MKKKLIIGAICLVILVVIIFLVNNGSSKNKDLKEEYLKVFDNRKFLIDGKTKNMKELLGEYGKIENYSFVDYGSDSHIEMFVDITSDVNADYIFNYEGNKMYAYLLDEDVVLNTEDGYSSINGDNTGWVRYTLNKKKLNKEVILNKKYKENICEYKNKEFNCDEFAKKEIEFLNTIQTAVEIVEYSE